MMKKPGSASDPLWFKDAIIYETHVKAFFDSDHDGTGDFKGLLQKLDYLHDLGVTCLWLLPFFPSPLRDDGYDISNYTDVHPSYGTIDDFRAFVEAAHQRNIQVLIELVVNHTSDQHPWFQRARKAPPGSPERNYYVWSDTEELYQDARIIFVDTEASNWTWDEEAKAYYWHRFFSHQPDLNYDNPEVLREVIDAMRFWSDLGVDAFRLDAVPYLIERPGTNCENLPETHAVIKEIRRQLDAEYENRIFLAEANQWPADVRAYFGDGDECHMAFHFPLMPRIFMALQMEDGYPIIEIMEQTPEIPADCHWAIFLRNHDELTLEMVTDEERDYMYRAYSADPRMRCNVGIRRRLAPLMQNNRRRVELLNGLLFSFPGTPVIYYGDELGMGDNIYLSDRNGVRTPMQWSADRNAGFSRANPARLYFPVIMDSVYGHQSINVEAQLEDASSLLSWMKNMIAIRKLCKVFGRGTLEFLHPSNRKVLAYVRRYEDSVVLCVANLSRFAQPCELDLSEFKRMIPVEMIGNMPFPPIGDLPYFLTLSAYGFYWFEIQAERKPTMAYRLRRPQTAADLGELVVLALRDEGSALFQGRARATLETRVLPRYLPQSRWFGAKTRSIASIVVHDWTQLPTTGAPAFLAMLNVRYNDGGEESYSVPLSVARGRGAEKLVKNRPQLVLSRLTTPRGPAVLHDALADESACQSMLAAISENAVFKTQHGEIRAFRLAGFDQARGPGEEALPSVPGAAEQSNSSVRFGERLILKLFRRLERGVNVDFEMSRYLAEQAGFDRIPPLVGAVEYDTPDGEMTTLAMLQGLLANQGDGWESTLDEFGRYLERCAAEAAPPPERETVGLSLLELARVEPSEEVRNAVGLSLDRAALLGQRTAQMHLALARDTADPAFAPEPMNQADWASLQRGMAALAGQALDLLARVRPSLPAEAAALADAALARRPSLLASFDRLAGIRAPMVKTRVHGDYHLGQVLTVKNDYYILDFEGEPARSRAERRQKRSPLKDVAGMLRSFSYAANSGFLQFAERHAVAHDVLQPWVEYWEAWSCAAFLRDYLETAGQASFLTQDSVELEEVLRSFILEKACYELLYELNNRPDWVSIPLAGITALLGGSGPRGGLQPTER
jgi:maltose alpha-D-glucosyltransferase/alpha-amylase